MRFARLPGLTSVERFAIAVIAKTGLAKARNLVIPVLRLKPRNIGFVSHGELSRTLAVGGHLPESKLSTQSRPASLPGQDPIV